MSPDSNPRMSLHKRLQSPLRPTANRSTSQISSISVEANQDLESNGRTLLSQDPKYTKPDTSTRQRTQSLRNAASPIEGSSEGLYLNTKSPVVQRTLSAPGTPGRSSIASSRTASVYSLSVPPLSSTSRSSSPSRKGKEKALEDVEVDGVDVEGELVSGHSGDATKGLRELVRRSTIVDGAGMIKDTSRSRAATTSGRLPGTRSQV
jgi:hypothetical protein